MAEPKERAPCSYLKPNSIRKYLIEGWDECTRCPLHETRVGKPVFPVGNPESKIMFIGDAPGVDGERRRTPFGDGPGELLRRILCLLDIEREAWVTNVVMCRPPDYERPQKNRAPSAEEIKACKERLLEEVYRVDPLMIVAMGADAAKVLGGPSCSQKLYRGEIVDVHIDSRVGKFPLIYPMMVTWSPYQVLRHLPASAAGAELPTDLMFLSTAEEELPQMIWDIICAYSAFLGVKAKLLGEPPPEELREVQHVLSLGAPGQGSPKEE